VTGRLGRPWDVLLVEDNPGDVRLIREVLAEAEERIELDVAPDGESALALLRGTGPRGIPHRPDLLLLDLNLPRKGGLEVLDELKADPDLRRIPVVVLTSSAADHDVTGAYDRHANCFVTKPLGLDDFVAAVRDIAGFWLGAAELPRG
jgi:two-component system, chemotaxis family, response regulator Rcp1